MVERLPRSRVYALVASGFKRLSYRESRAHSGTGGSNQPRVCVANQQVARICKKSESQCGESSFPAPTDIGAHERIITTLLLSSLLETLKESLSEKPLSALPGNVVIWKFGSI